MKNYTAIFPLSILTFSQSLWVCILLIEDQLIHNIFLNNLAMFIFRPEDTRKCYSLLVCYYRSACLWPLALITLHTSIGKSACPFENKMFGISWNRQIECHLVYVSQANKGHTPSVVETAFAHQKSRGSEQLTSIVWKRKKIRDCSNKWRSKWEKKTFTHTNKQTIY